MGSTVLDSGVPIEMGLHVYAHCRRQVSGGVTLLVINNDRHTARTLTMPDTSERYTLDAAVRRTSQSDRRSPPRSRGCEPALAARWRKNGGGQSDLRAGHHHLSDNS